jgi:hypothetical protein
MALQDEDRRFKNSWSRLNRAAHHLAAFQAEWRSLFPDNGPTIVIRYDNDSGWFIANVSFDELFRERIRNNVLSLIIGEFAYQLRAALDGLIWDAITIEQGAEPPSDANRLEFPILNGKIRIFKDCAFLKFPFPDKLKTWLESIQPDSTEKPEGHPDRGLANALEDIHNLARLDRHRRLRVVAGVPTQLKVGIVCNPSRKVIARERIWCDILNDQYDFLRFQVESINGVPPRKLNLETHVTFEILFEDIEPFEDVPTGEQFGFFMEAVRYVIMRFEEEFSAHGRLSATC